MSELDRLAERLAERLGVLEDRAEISDLVARYGPIVDSGSGAALGEIWTPDGRYEVGDEFALAGPDVPGLTELPPHQAYLREGCAHVLTPAAVRLDGDEASAVNHSVVLVRRGEQWIADRVSANEWRFARTAAGWRVTLRRNRLLDGDEAARGLFAAVGGPTGA
ncbi:nuclear transport factor 2 family protein [Leucobacter luti]|uniref:nuclear transport factor 2 family protein n=1 Tax=Leucobacter luti TaxID=340320 RepID=UPI003D0161C4